MRVGGNRRYTKEFIRSFLQEIEAGTSLTEACKSRGIQKSTGAYWVTNRDRYLAPGDVGNSPVAVQDRYQRRFWHESWRLRFKTFSVISKKLEKPELVTISDLIGLEARLQESQTEVATTSTAAGKKQVSQEIVEKRAEIQIKVSNYLQRQKPDGAAAPVEGPIQDAILAVGEGPGKNLAAPRAEPPSGASGEGRSGSIAVGKSEANGAT